MVRKKLDIYDKLASSPIETQEQEPPASDDAWVCQQSCQKVLRQGEACSQLCLAKCHSLCNHHPTPPQPSNKASLMAPFEIIMVGVAASVFLLFTCYLVAVKLRRSIRNTSSIPPAAQSNDTDEDFLILDETQDPLANNPVWLINTVGLQVSIISSITVCKYKRGEGLIEGTDCSVCLNEFREDETLRLLPKCSHAFHIPCIDTWLRSHKNCPLCRAPIVANTDRRSLTPSMESNFNGSNSREEIQMEIFGSGNGWINNLTTAGTYSNEDENRGTDAEISKEGLPSSFVNGSGNRVFSDLAADNDRVLEDEIQPVRIRRSVSMDSSLGSMISGAMCKFLREEPEEISASHFAEVKESNLGIVSNSSSVGPRTCDLMAS